LKSLSLLLVFCKIGPWTYDFLLFFLESFTCGSEKLLLLWNFNLLETADIVRIVAWTWGDSSTFLCSVKVIL